jgi:hypothetical protein
VCVSGFNVVAGDQKGSALIALIGGLCCVRLYERETEWCMRCRCQSASVQKTRR